MEKALDDLTRDGYAVIENFIDVTGVEEELKQDLIKLNPALQTSWSTYNLPVQAHKGMFQRLCSNFPALWRFRQDRKVIDLFKYLYSKLWNEDITELATSIDAFTLLPPGDYQDIKWAHTDQMIKGTYRSIQSQIVVTRSPTCYFEATPKSHLVHDMLVDQYKLDPDGIFFKYPKDDYEQIAKLIAEQSGWQIPINPPAGSIIIWLSSTIHASHCGKGLPSDPWRCVIYISMHPVNDTYKRCNLHDVIVNNDSTYHWGDLVKRIPGYYKASKYHPNIDRLMRDPKLVYDLISKPSPFINGIVT